jgi:colicin import membrane protein
MTDTTPYSIPQESGNWSAIMLAALMHAVLFAFLWIGIRWQSQTPVTVEAEVWNLQSREAAPKLQPQPETNAVVPEPKAEKEPQVEKPDIAVEQEKKRKEKEARQEEERAVRLREKQALLEQEKAEALAKKKDLAKKKRMQEVADEKLAEKFREEEMKRMTGGSGNSGEAPKSQGIQGDPTYATKIRQKIRSNTVFIVPKDLQGNPSVEFEVKLFPDGSLRGGLRKIKSSGVPGFDEAVQRAIELSQPFPPDKSGAIPSSFMVIHQPKDN